MAPERKPRISSCGMRGTTKCARRLASRLELPDPWSVEALCAWVAERRGRPITVLDRPSHGDSITAAVISTRSADYIFCRDDLHGIHRDHAVCHELGHLLSGHTERDRLLGVSAPSLAVLHRNCDYSDGREEEAEAIADAIMERVSLRLVNSERDRRQVRIIHGFGDALR